MKWNRSRTFISQSTNTSRSIHTHTLGNNPVLKFKLKTNKTGEGAGSFTIALCRQSGPITFLFDKFIKSNSVQNTPKSKKVALLDWHLEFGVCSFIITGAFWGRLSLGCSVWATVVVDRSMSTPHSQDLRWCFMLNNDNNI